MTDVEIAQDGSPFRHQTGSTQGGASAAVITWKNIKVAAVDTKGASRQILNNVSGFLQPTKLLGIMGPSGSGKSALLDTLAGRLSPSVHMSGEILLNGHKSKLTRGMCAYVSHDEALVGTLSVREALHFVALLRLPASMSRKEKSDRAEEVLLEMGLKVCADTTIGNWHLKGISGGQKRRLSIAQELITHPTLLFLDEPTSGLDSAAAFHVVSTVKSLALHGRTILTTLHQPSVEVFELFDYLCLLSSGSVVFYGELSAADAAFNAAGLPCPARRNPCDHYMHCINPDFMVGKSDDSEYSRNMSALLKVFAQQQAPQIEERIAALSVAGVPFTGNRNDAHWTTQSAALIKRTLLNNWRDLGMFWVRIVMYVMLAICIGTTWFDLDESWKAVNSRFKMVYFTLSFLSFMSIAGFPTHGEDMELYKSERLNGYYRPWTFALANFMAGTPFILAMAVMVGLIQYWLSSLNDDSGIRVIYYILNLFAALMVAESMMLTIAALVPHFLMGIAVGASILGVFMLLGGLLVTTDSLPRPVWYYPLHFITFHSYSLQGFMKNEFLGTKGWGCPCELQQKGCPEKTCSLTGREAMAAWEIPNVGRSKWVDLAIQLGMVVFYRIAFYLGLRGRERPGGMNGGFARRIYETIMKLLPGK